LHFPQNPQIGYFSCCTKVIPTVVSWATIRLADSSGTASHSRGAALLNVRLVVLSAGKTQGKAIPVTRFPFLIGRDPACQLRPGSGLVSGRHCALHLRQGGLFLKDLNSTNGTLLDGVALSEERQLKGGERIQVGPLVFGVTIERFVSVSDPTPLPGMESPSVPETADDDEAASILLFLAKDDKSPSGGVEFGPEDVADNETDLGSPPDGGTKEIPKLGGNDKSKDQPAPADSKRGDTSTVADALLKQYLRRPRK
jgi:pSer/pThr/pTyr-binding forkhead associated (FHA) protein